MEFLPNVILTYCSLSFKINVKVRILTWCIFRPYALLTSHLRLWLQLHCPSSTHRYYTHSTCYYEHYDNFCYCQWYINQMSLLTEDHINMLIFLTWKISATRIEPQSPVSSPVLSVRLSLSQDGATTECSHFSWIIPILFCQSYLPWTNKCFPQCFLLYACTDLLSPHILFWYHCRFNTWSFKHNTQGGDKIEYYNIYQSLISRYIR